MHQLYGQARRAALVDGLTGLGNHRAFQDELAFQLEEAKWQGAPLALLIFDVDGLKAVNDGRATSPAIDSWRRSVRSQHRSCVAAIAPTGSAATSSRSSSPIRTSISGSKSGGECSRRHCAVGTERAHQTFSLSVGVSAFPTRAATPASCTATRTPPCIGASATVGLPWSPSTRATTARPRPNGRRPNSPPTSRRVLAKRALRPVYQPIFSLETRTARRLRGPRQADGMQRRSTTRLSLRRRRGGRPDGRARPALPGGSWPLAAVDLPRGRLPEREPLTPDARGRRFFRPSDVKASSGDTRIALEPDRAGADGTRGSRGPRRASSQREGAAVRRPSTRRR